jgi:hypothetical protein
MSTAERFPNPPELDPYEELTPPPIEDLHAEHRPSLKRTTHRWEFGFFVRKVVNGWLAYYKVFPPSSRPADTAPAPHRSLHGSQEPSEGELSFPGEVRPLSGHSSGSTEGGPVGQTRYEAGFFLSSQSETADSEDEDS